MAFGYTMSFVIATGVSLLVLGLVFGVLRLWSEVPSAILANVVAAFPLYWLSRKWVSESDRRSRVAEVLSFWAMAVAFIAFSALGADVARNLGRQGLLDHFERTVLVLAVNAVLFGIFWLLKLVADRPFRGFLHGSLRPRGGDAQATS